MRSTFTQLSIVMYKKISGWSFESFTFVFITSAEEPLLYREPFAGVKLKYLMTFCRQRFNGVLLGRGCSRPLIDSNGLTGDLFY